MEFKFRAVDDRPTSYIAPSSAGISHSSTQGPGVGFPTMDPPVNHDPMRNHNNYLEAILREREKERIREEILAIEIAKRRVLEAEVRRELAVLEREMAMRRGDPEGLSLEEQWASMRFDGPRLPLSHRFDEHLPFPSRSNACDMFLLPRHPDALSPDLKLPSSGDKVIVLAKPNSNLSGAKRKAVAPPVVPFSLKKPKEEWSCALCQFSATGERKLNEHLEGEKHRTLEAELRDRRKRKNSNNSPLSKKMKRKRYKLTESNDTANSIVNAVVEEESLKHNEIWNGSEKKSGCIKDMEFKSEELVMQKFKDAENTNKINRAEMVQKVEKTAELKNKKNFLIKKKKKKNFKFWCELCQVGAHSEIVMEHHKKGKKHTESLQHNETCNDSEKKDNTKDVEFKSEELPVQKFQSSENLNEINGAILNEINGAELMQGEELPVQKFQSSENLNEINGALLNEINEAELVGEELPVQKFQSSENLNEINEAELVGEELPVQKFQSSENLNEINEAELVGEELPVQKFQSSENLNEMNGAILNEINGAELVHGEELPVQKFQISENLNEINGAELVQGEGEKKQKKITCIGSGKKENTKDVEFKSEELPMQKFECSENLNEINGAELVQVILNEIHAAELVQGEELPVQEFRSSENLNEINGAELVQGEEEKKQKKITCNGSGKKENTKDVECKSEELPMQKFECSENLNEINGAELVQVILNEINAAELVQGEELPVQKFRSSENLNKINGAELVQGEEEKKQKKITCNGSEKKENTKDVEFKSEELPMQKFECSESLNEINGAELVLGEEKPAEHKNKKNFKFWCEICQVGAYCAVVMEDHKKGKRHMETLKHKDRLNGSERKKESAKDVIQESKSKSEKLQMQKSQNSNKLNKKNAAKTVQGVEKKAVQNNRKDFKFWCEICEVGAYCPVVMEDHEKGKKHFRRVEKLKTK